MLGTSVDYLLFEERRTRGENGTELSDVEERFGKLPQAKIVSIVFRKFNFCRSAAVS